MLPNSAYIHIPFCRRRCYYCDFPVFVVGDRLAGENSGTIAEYLQQLGREIDLQPNFGEPLKTIFFGGGTPSLLTPSQIDGLITKLVNKFGISDAPEISIEVDPGTFDRARMAGYISAGVNRFSMGVQAFQDKLLTLSGRSHNVRDIYRAIDIFHQVGVKNWSLDLISGLPEQTIDDWQFSLERAIELSPTHISCYDLIIEAGTPFAKQYQPGDRPLPSDETAAMMYRSAARILGRQGWEHYEISNYAKPGNYCRHNLTYWHNLPYYAFGMGAASYLNGYRFTRPRQTQTYYDWVRSGANSQGEIVTKGDRFLETLMLGLRLSTGIKLATIARDFGDRSLVKLWSVISRYHQCGWVEVSDRNRSILTSIDRLESSFNLRLTDPEGLLFSNEVLSAIFTIEIED
jgi:putative oxygen-independent coproporphyrinogen III oxidase